MSSIAQLSEATLRRCSFLFSLKVSLTRQQTKFLVAPSIRHAQQFFISINRTSEQKDAAFRTRNSDFSQIRGSSLYPMMCVVTCDNDDAVEDTRVTYLTWENGQYVPAPPLFYVPGLRAIVQKQSGLARWHAASHNLAETCSLPSTYYDAGHAPGAPPGAVFEGRVPHISVQDFSRHGFSYQPATSAFAMSTDNLSNSDGLGTCTYSHTGHRAEDGGQDISQQSFPPPASVANTSQSHSRSCQGDSLPLISHDIKEGDINSGRASQKLDPACTSARRPLTEFSSFDIHNQLRSKEMSSATPKKQPATEAPIKKSVTPPRQHTPTSSITSIKTILKNDSNSTTTTSQGEPQRKKSVRFIFDTESNGPHRSASLVPSAKRSASLRQQNPKRPSSSPGKASIQLMEVRARLAKAGQAVIGNDGISKAKQRTQSKAQPQKPHHTLTVENLTTFCEQNGGIQGGGSGEDEDDIASNTDFELAVRMKRRWI